MEELQTSVSGKSEIELQTLPMTLHT